MFCYWNTFVLLRKLFGHFLYYTSSTEEEDFSQVKTLCPQTPYAHVFSPVIALSGRETFLPLTVTSGHIVHYQHYKYRQTVKPTFSITFNFEGTSASNRMLEHNVFVHLERAQLTTICDLQVCFLTAMQIPVTGDKRGSPTSHLASFLLSLTRTPIPAPVSQSAWAALQNTRDGGAHKQ